MSTKERLSKLNDALRQVAIEIVVTETNLRDLKDQELIIRGQISEREFDAAPAPIATLPIFRSEEKLQEALDNRGKGFFGEDEADIIVQRQQVFEREALKKVNYINDETD